MAVESSDMAVGTNSRVVGFGFFSVFSSVMEFFFFFFLIKGLS